MNGRALGESGVNDLGDNPWREKAWSDNTPCYETRT